MEILKGKLVTLRPMSPEEVKLIHKWANNPDIIPYWYRKKKSLKEIKEDWTPNYFSDKDPESGRCFAIEIHSKPIGMISHSKINHKMERIEIDGVIIGDGKNWDKGYGSDAIKTFINYLFSHFNVNEVWITTYKTNKRAIKLYQKTGFKIEKEKDKDVILSIHR